MKYIFASCIFLFSFFSGNAQKNSLFTNAELTLLQGYEDTLGLMSHIIVNDSLSENRFAATRKMIKTLVTALKTPNSFNYPFEQLRSVSIQYPKDSTFRIFTWQLYVDKNDYRYYGAIQMNTKDLQLFPLIDRSTQVRDVESEQLNTKNWYGALYYNIKQYDTPTGTNYLLFGFDGYSFFEKRKVLETLSFQDGKPFFGVPDILVPIQETNQLRPVNRFALTYSADASIVCNYDEIEQKIIYSHLILGGNAWEGRPTYIPDGSFDGFQYENGKWVYKEEIFRTVTPEGEYPRPEPVLDERKRDGKRKDLFGQ